MQYLGGKARTYKDICSFIENIRKPGQQFVEPFCGAGWITQGVSGRRQASDANEALINMFKALQQGWSPPTELAEDKYLELKRTQNPSDPLTAFAGFGCSFGGKWFGGYARGVAGRNYASNAASSLDKKRRSLMGVDFLHRPYQEASTQNCLIYCDPPYANTTGYGAVGTFDSATFWEWVREQSLVNTVLVSEYTAPEDFTCVWGKETKTDLHTKGGKESRTEKLFMFNGGENS